MYSRDNDRGAVLHILLVVVAIMTISIGVYFWKNYFTQETSVESTNKSESGFNKLVNNSDNFITPTPPYSGVLSGKITKTLLNTYKVDIDPIFLRETSKPYENEEVSKNANFTIKFYKNQKEIHSEKFTARKCIDWSPGDYCGEHVFTEGDIGTTVVNITEMPDSYAIFTENQEIYRFNSPGVKPTMSITDQDYKNGVITVYWSEPNYKYTFLASISNGERAVSLFSDRDFHMLNKDGSKILYDDHIKYNHLGFIEGSLTASIYVSDGVQTWVAKSKTFGSVVNPVEVKIEEPVENTEYDTNVRLGTTLMDPATGSYCSGSSTCAERTGNTVTWTSDIDGLISTDGRALCQYLSVGEHTITLRVENRNGTSGTDTVKINIINNWHLDPKRTGYELSKQRHDTGEYCYGI